MLSQLFKRFLSIMLVSHLSISAVIFMFLVKFSDHVIDGTGKWYVLYPKMFLGAFCFAGLALPTTMLIAFALTLFDAKRILHKK